MAMQHLVALSSHIDGAAIIAGSPYGCGSLHGKTYKCSTFVPRSADRELVQYLRRRFAEGLIDDPANLKDMPVVLFSGKNDCVVDTEVMRATYRQLRVFTREERILTSFDTRASHVWSTDHGTCACGSCLMDRGITPTRDATCCNVNNCNYDLSGVSLQHFFGGRNHSAIKPRKNAKASLAWVDQRPYIPGGNPKARMMRWALVYVPTGCEERPSRCRIHVNYHGCQYRDYWRRRKWARLIDLNEYGEANNIVIVYPQAAGDTAGGIGCWNWGGWGDDIKFDTRQSLQLATVIALLQDLDTAVRVSAVKVGNSTLPVAREVSDDEPWEEYWSRVGDELGGDGEAARAQALQAETYFV